MTLFIHDYKTIAHELIEELAESGMKKRKIYIKLAISLGVPHNMAHLHAMTTISQVEKAIKVLGWMKRNRIKKGKLKVRKSPREMFLSGHKRSII